MEIIKIETMGNEKVKPPFIDIGTAANDPSTEHPFETTDPNPIVNAEKEPDEAVEGEKERIGTTDSPHKGPYLPADKITYLKIEYKAGERAPGIDFASGKLALAKTGCPGLAT